MCVLLCLYWTNSCDMAAAKKREFLLYLLLVVITRAVLPFIISFY